MRFSERIVEIGEMTVLFYKIMDEYECEDRRLANAGASLEI